MKNTTEKQDTGRNKLTGIFIVQDIASVLRRKDNSSLGSCILDFYLKGGKLNAL